MATLTKRATVYLDPAVHQALKMRAASSETSISDLVNEAVKRLMSEDREDLKAFDDRAGEPEITYENLLEQLKADGTL
ncbi:ribbon-helix-helix domain-containing protein [Endozoicomonas sp. 2B-B]